MIIKNKYRCIYCNTEFELKDLNKKIIICPYCRIKQINSFRYKHLSEYKFLVPWTIPEEINQTNKSSE